MKGVNRLSADVKVCEPSPESCKVVAGEEVIWELVAWGTLLLFGVECLIAGKAV